MSTPVSTPIPESSSSLDRSLAGGIAFSGVAKAISQLVAWVVTFHVARILMASDYGLITTAAIYIGLLRYFSEFGLGLAVLNMKELESDQVAQLGGFALLLGITAALVTWGLSGALSQFLHAPDLARALPVLGLSAAISTAATVPAALLQRRLAYKRISVIEIVRSFISSLALLAFASAGFRFWSLVFNELLATGVAALLLTLSAPHRIAFPRLARIGRSLKVSGEILVANLSWYGYTNADFFVAARRLGQDSLGVYSFAWQLITLPTEKVTTMVMSVTPGIFAKVQDDLDALSRYFILLTELLSLALFPACIGIALVADNLVPLLLGDKWLGTIPILQLLAVFGTVRCVQPLVTRVLVARRRSKISMSNNILGLLVLPPAFLIGSRWGPTGIAGAWLIAYPPLAIIQYIIVLRELKMPAKRLLTAFWPAVTGCLIMAFVVEGTNALLKIMHVEGGTRLVLQIIFGALVYATFAWNVRGKRLRAALAALSWR